MLQFQAEWGDLEQLSYVEAAPWMSNIVVDGRLISGRNPPSAEGVDARLAELLVADL